MASGLGARHFGLLVGLISPVLGASRHELSGSRGLGVGFSLDLYTLNPIQYQHKTLRKVKDSHV